MPPILMRRQGGCLSVAADARSSGRSVSGAFLQAVGVHATHDRPTRPRPETESHSKIGVSVSIPQIGFCTHTYAGTMALTPTGLSTSSRRYDFCEGLASSTRRRVATLRRSGSNTCPASPHPIRRPHAIIFRPFRSSPSSSTMHFIPCRVVSPHPRFAAAPPCPPRLQALPPPCAECRQTPHIFLRKQRPLLHGF